MAPEYLVDQSHLLVAAMGRWPSFHDAIVLAIERTEHACRVVIHVFDMTNEVDPRGYFVLRLHHLVVLNLTGISCNTLPEAQTSAVLASLAISAEAGKLKVDFESHMDLDGTVLCDRVEVVSVVPCDASGLTGRRRPNEG